MSNYVYSTTTCDNIFPVWIKDQTGINIVSRQVLIKGGTNVANRKTFITQYGAATEVSDDDLEMLEQNDAFKRMRDNGFYTIVRGQKRAEIEEVLPDLEAADKSAPMTEEDVTDAKVTAPSVSDAVVKPKQRGRKAK